MVGRLPRLNGHIGREGVRNPHAGRSSDDFKERSLSPGFRSSIGDGGPHCDKLARKPYLGCYIDLDLYSLVYATCLFACKLRSNRGDACNTCPTIRLLNLHSNIDTREGQLLQGICISAPSIFCALHIFKRPVSMRR